MEIDLILHYYVGQACLWLFSPWWS